MCEAGVGSRRVAWAGCSASGGGPLSSLSILIVRMDRLGDVVLSLPALGYLRECLPDARLTFAAQPANRDAIAPFLREREIDAPDATTDSIEPVLHGRRFNAAVVLHASRAVFRELAASRVPVRFAD